MSDQPIAVEQKEAKWKQVDSVEVEFPADGKIERFITDSNDKLGLRGRWEELFDTIESKDGTKKKVPKSRYVERYDGIEYLFERGKKQRVPLAAARHWLGEHKVDEAFGLKRLDDSQRTKEISRTTKRHSFRFPMTALRIIMKDNTPEELPEGTVRVG